jgi:hypothetical protein
MGMSTDVIIGHFLKADDDISTIVNSHRFEDTLISCDDGLYFSNSGNTVFHWNKYDDKQSVTVINDEVISTNLKAFVSEISEITDILDTLKIKYEIIYGANTWYN